MPRDLGAIAERIVRRTPTKSSRRPRLRDSTSGTPILTRCVANFQNVLIRACES
jgi:hypothetical protein